jgi:hypothetical protein
MGRSALVKPEAEDLAMDDLAIRGSATPTDRTPRLRSAEPRLA